MPWIRTVQPEEAIGAVKEIYNKQLERQGFVAAPSEIISLKPRFMSLWHQVGQETRSQDWKLSRAQREMIATVTSALCRCHL